MQWFTYSHYSRLITWFETLLTQVWYPTTVATLSRRVHDVIESYFIQSVDESEIILHPVLRRRGRFLAGFAHALEHTGGYTPAEAKRVAGMLLPDVMPYDPTRQASFPDNGRTLTDDAFDWFMRVLTNGRVSGDSVGPHSDLLREFPYVGPPHRSRATNETNDRRQPT